METTLTHEMAANLPHETATNVLPGDAWYTLAERDRICRLVFTFILLSLLYSFFSHTLVHQLQAPVLRFPYVDPSYWILHLASIPEFITGHFIVAGLFDGTLFLTCILTLLFPASRSFIIFFFGLYLIYFITFNSYGALHTGSKIGILLMPIPFMARGPRSFTYLWQGMRYLALFVYADAFLWKFFRWTWLTNDQAILVIKKNLTAYLYFNAHTAQANVYRWFLLHPSVANWLFKAGILAEGTFLLGFFTTKFDRYLFLLSILLPVGFLFFADAFFFELIILSFTYHIPGFLRPATRLPGQATPAP
jgi:hypothetical protein